MIKQFKKKPVVIEAIQFSDDTGVILEIQEFMDIDTLTVSYEIPGAPELYVPTLEDGADNTVKHVASVGDWIIKGIQGEFCPCKPDIFEQTYDEVE
jgi:hypothetical protein